MIFAVFLSLTVLSITEIRADPSCPARNGQDSVYIPDEDCTKFWQCSNGTPYLFDCPAGLNFNPTLNVCDWPDQAGCNSSGDGSDSSEDSGNSSDSSSSGSNESNDGVSGEDDNNSNGGDNSGNNNDSDSSSSNESRECPSQDGEESVYIADENCGKFWQCSNGVAYQQDCPAGLHFNPSLNVCDWPDQAGCNSGSGSDEDNNSSSGGDSEENNDGDENSNENDDQSGDDSSNSSSESNGGSSSGSGSSEGLECPAKDGEQPVYIPDADCSKFWQCSNGVAYQQDCPAGLQFNPSLNVCDWPNQAGCNSGSSSEEDSGENPNPGNNSSEEDDGSKGSDGSGEDDSSSSNSSSSSSSSESDEGDRECPARDGEQSVYFPDDDCGRFWQCSNGVAYPQDCPAGLHFNPSLNVCDWPDQAGCNGGSSSSSSSEEDSNEESQENNDDDSNEENNGSDNEGNDSNEGNDGGSDSSTNSRGSSESSEGPECPARDGANSVYIPDEDCTKFWQCSNGTPYLFDCPDNLYFNPTLNVCDWPDQAGCRGK